MEKALRDKKRAIVLCVIFFVIALSLTVAAILSARERLYVTMALFAVCSSVFYYFAVFAIFRFLDARAAIDMLDILSCSGKGRGALKISELSEAMGWKSKTTRRFIEKCIKKGYIR